MSHISTSRKHKVLLTPVDPVRQIQAEIFSCVLKVKNWSTRSEASCQSNPSQLCHSVWEVWRFSPHAVTLGDNGVLINTNTRLPVFIPSQVHPRSHGGADSEGCFVNDGTHLSTSSLLLGDVENDDLGIFFCSLWSNCALYHLENVASVLNFSEETVAV